MNFLMMPMPIRAVSMHSGIHARKAFRFSSVSGKVIPPGTMPELWIFLPAGVILFGLWVSGIYLFILPFWARRKQRARLAGADSSRH
jgi:hypothetical protein